MKDKLVSFLLLIGFTVTICILLYPSFMESVNNIAQTTEIRSYQLEAEKNEVAERLLKNAQAYNERLAEKQKEVPYTYRGANATDEDYESQLDVGGGVSTIAYLDIPSIKSYLPIVHGTKDSDLEYKVGHIYGTSLPIGGPGTHSVLAAHTGLKKADLFDHLTDMKEGDEFLIHVLGMVNVYQVDAIHVVFPAEEDPYLQIEDGKDYVTLYTCTPYGVNDRRLLVRGKRTGQYTEEENTETGMSASTKNRVAIAKAAGFASIPTLFLIIGSIVIFRKKRINPTT